MRIKTEKNEEMDERVEYLWYHGRADELAYFADRAIDAYKEEFNKAMAESVIKGLVLGAVLLVAGKFAESRLSKKKNHDEFKGEKES